MARVQQYFRGQEASSQMPVNSADKSGQIIGGSVADAASAVMAPLMRMAQQQQAALDESRLAKLRGEYASDVLTGAEKIKQNLSSDPEKALTELKTFRQQTRDKYLETAGSTALRQKLSVDMENFNSQQVLHDLSWGSQQASLLTQQNYVDRIQSDAKFLSTSGDYNAFLEKAQALDADRESYKKAFPGLGEASKVIDQGLESYVRAAVYAGIDKGKSFEEAQRLSSGAYDQFITPQVRDELLSKVDQAQKGAQTQSEFLTAAKAVTETFASAGGTTFGEETVAGLEEKISLAEYDRANGLVRFKAGAISKEKYEFFENQSASLKYLRDAKLAAVASTATDDIETKGELLARFDALTKYDKRKGRNTLKADLMEVSRFQRDATKAYYDGKLSSKTFSGWMEVARAAITSDIEGAMKETKKKGYNLDANKLTASKAPESKKIRKALTGILKGADLKSGRGVAVDTMDFFLDSLNDLTQGDLTHVKNLSDETIAGLVKTSKAKAKLKSLGYSEYLTVGDRIDSRVGSFEITGHDEDGTPLVKVTPWSVGQ